MPSVWQRFQTWGKKRVVDPFIEYLKQDAEPSVLARSAAVGFFLGLCPIVGVSAGLCLLGCFILGPRLHAPMALLFNFVAVPVELLLIVPFMRFGEWVLHAESVDVIPKHFSDLFHPGPALKGLGHALLGWLIICALLAWPAALALTPLFAFLRRKYSSLQRLGSDDGPLLEEHGRDDRSTVSDVELAVGTSGPSTPVAQRAAALSPRSSSAPSALSKFSPHV